MAIKEGDIILAPLPQADGRLKNRPALVLREMPGYGDLLVCGISTQLREAQEAFDEMIAAGDPDFAESGLLMDSLIRLGFLAVLPRWTIPGTIGKINGERHHRLLLKLSAYLTKNVKRTKTIEKQK